MLNNVVGNNLNIDGCMPVKTASPVFRGSKVDLSQKPDEFVRQNDKNQEPKKRHSILMQMGLSILALGGIVAAAILTKGKTSKTSKSVIKQQAPVDELQKLVENGKVSQEYLNIFKKTKDLEGNEFIAQAYSELLSTMGYGKTGPRLRIKTNASNGGCSANEIVISTKTYNNKMDQLEVLRHELEHFRQNDMAYRAFGKDQYVEAKAAPTIEKLKMNEEFCKEKFNGRIFSEVSPSELESFMARLKMQIAEDAKIYETTLKQKGIIPSGTSEYNEAKKYLEGFRNYRTPSMILTKAERMLGYSVLEQTNPTKYKEVEKLFKEYHNNELEKGAFKEGDTIKEMYDEFLEALGL